MAKAARTDSIDGVSNATVTILLLLTLLVSVIGAWSVLQDADSAQVDGGAEGGQGVAKALIGGTPPSLDGIANTKETGRAVLDVPDGNDE